ncbi:transcriptional regulator, TetR family [Lutimaribacter pacificus]|uniref:Transcriptional regulator, TetR family n=1 Tax=Lutimaribacter pacificus TaxID=391948 RepID=A0A1H0HMB8_9RHOB|nr:TetR/AcrR family transcriptional regulator [Lutimaribacter pacificus]SDO20349.1 transcriptional regulator, TetR family [Lutimaribacter pacificus]SHK33945.1 transcriptional regulator, TetR family [Lutimaribacter pacificus]
MDAKRTVRTPRKRLSDEKKNDRQSIREQTRAFKRSRILEVASKCFFEHGYELTTIELLSNELGVTKPFIYSYFKNKRAILEAVHLQVAERLLSEIQLIMSNEASPDKALVDFIRLFVNENILNQVASGVFLQEQKHLSAEALKASTEIERSVHRNLSKLIQDGIDQGLFEIEDASMASMAIIGMVRWVHRWYRQDGRHSPETIAQKLGQFGLNMVKCTTPLDHKLQSA